MGLKESMMVAETSLTVSDYIRCVVNAASRKVTLQVLLDSSFAYLRSLGFLIAADLTSGVSNIQKINKQSSNYGLLDSDSIILCDVSGADFDINLMAAADVWDAATSKGQVFTVKLEVISSTNKVNINASGAETIDGASTFALVGPNLVFVSFVSDGSNWWTTGG